MANNVPNNPILGEVWTDDNNDDWVFNGEAWDPIACIDIPVLLSSPSDMAFVQDEAITSYDASVHFSGIINNYALGGTWPTGISIDSNGLITGTPTNSGAFIDLTIDAIYLQGAGSPLSTATFTVDVTGEALNAPLLAIPLLNSLVATNGVSPTLARVGAADVVDTYGNIISIAENVGRYQGARYTINILDEITQQQSLVGWNTNAGLVSIFSSTVIRVAIGATSGDKVYGVVSGDYSDKLMRGRVELRVTDSANNNEKVTLSVQGNGTDYTTLARQEVTLTDAWQTFTCDANGDSTGLLWTNGVRFCIEGPSSAAGKSYDVEIRNAQLEDMTGRSNVNPSEFTTDISVFSTSNDNTVASNGLVNTSTPGSELASLDGLLGTIDDINGTWPTGLINNFVVCVTVVIPANSILDQNIFGYRSQALGSYLRLDKINSGAASANKIRLVKQSLIVGYSAIISAVAPNVGSTVSIKLRVGSATAINPGITLWLDNIKEADVEILAIDDLTITAGQELHLCTNQGGNDPWNEALKYFEIHEGDFTDSEVEGIIPGDGTPTPPAEYYYLDDFDTIGPPADDTDIAIASRNYINGLQHPITYSVEEQEYMPDKNGYRKYNYVTAQASGLNHLDEIQTLIPNEVARNKMYTPGHCMERALQRRYAELGQRACVFGHAVPFAGTTLSSGDVVDNTNYSVQYPPVVAGNGDTVELENGYGIKTDTCVLGDGIFAGHWLYARRTRISGYINATATVIAVDNLEFFKAGLDVCIWDYNSNWINAEHCRVISRSGASGAGNITVTQRGYMSDRVAHADGSFIATHMTENAGLDYTKRHWVWNMTTQCPLDASGNRYIDYAAEFHNTYWNRKWNNINIYPDLSVIGIVYDVDRDYCPAVSPASDGAGTLLLQADANNDGVADFGVDPVTGQRWIKDGWEAFYDLIRNAPGYGRSDWMQVGGTDTAPGLIANTQNGVQLEAMFTGFGQTGYSYAGLSAQFANFCFREDRAAEGPLGNHILFKQSSGVYDTKNWDGTGAIRKNGPVRMGMAAMCMKHGAYHHQNQSGDDTGGDPWYNEFSVNLNGAHGSYLYGESPLKSDYVECQIAANWLGNPIDDITQPGGKWQRQYGTEFDAANDMYGGAQLFDSGIVGWTYSGTIALSHNTTVGVPLDGAGCLEIAAPTSFNYWAGSNTVTGPAITGSLVANNEYTFIVAMKADVPNNDYRRVKVYFGGQSNHIMVGNEWKRYVLVFKVSSTSSNKPYFELGGYSTKIWIDTCMVYAGNPDRIYREFDNGCVCLNMSKTGFTFDLPSDNFQRIKGDQDPSINSGALCTNGQVYVEPYDGLLLVRQEP